MVKRNTETGASSGVDDGDVAARVTAVRDLAAPGRTTRQEATSQLLAIIRDDPAAPVRTAALEALPIWGHITQEVREVLIHAARNTMPGDKDLSARFAAMKVLAEFGLADQEMRRALVEAFNEDVRDLPANWARDNATRSVGDMDATSRASAVCSGHSQDTRTEGIARKLTAIRYDPDATVRWMAINQLLIRRAMPVELHDEAREVLRAIAASDGRRQDASEESSWTDTLGSDGTPSVAWPERALAIRALAQHGLLDDLECHDLVYAIAPLSELLMAILSHDEDVSVRAAAAKILGMRGQATDEIHTALLDMVRDEEHRDPEGLARAAGIRALRMLGLIDDAFRAVLVTTIAGGDPAHAEDQDARDAAINAVVALRLTVDDVRGALTSVLYLPDYTQFETAIAALRKLNMVGDDVSAGLVTVLTHGLDDLESDDLESYEDAEPFAAVCCAVEAVIGLGLTGQICGEMSRG